QEVLDDAVGLRADTLMRANGCRQIRCPAVVQEEDPLTEPPERRGPEFPRARLSLTDTVGESEAHVVHQQVRIQPHRLIAQGGYRGVAGREARRVAKGAPDG